RGAAPPVLHAPRPPRGDAGSADRHARQPAPAPAGRAVRDRPGDRTAHLPPRGGDPLMATREWIESAALKEKRPVGHNLERRSHHLRDGALTVDQVEQARAARYLQRQGLPPIPDPTDPDKVVHVREILGLPEVPVPTSADAIIGHDVIEVLLRTLRRDG